MIFEQVLECHSEITLPRSHRHGSLQCSGTVHRLHIQTSKFRVSTRQSHPVRFCIFGLISNVVYIGCSFGYHAGGWGKPPVDERGRPLYGDVFGVEAPVNPFEDEKPSEQLWGELDSDEESSSDDESEEESEEEGDQVHLYTLMLHSSNIY